MSAPAYVILSGDSRATPPRPSGHDRKTMRAADCSHRDHEGAPVFDAIYFGVYWSRGDRSRLDACLRVKRDLGVDAVQLCVQGGYPGYLSGATYDFRNDLGKYAA